MELFASALLILLFILFLNPLMIWMPSSMEMLVVALTLVAFAVFASFLWREQGGDEREREHRSLAGRVAFLSGAIVITVGITYQSFYHTIDPWLISTLIVMVLSKLISRRYFDRNH